MFSIYYSTHNTEKFLSDAINKIEFKLESLINDKMEKLNKSNLTICKFIITNVQF